MAAKDFLVHIDLNKQQLLNAALQVLATAPAGPVIGQIYWNSTDKTAYAWTGSPTTPNTNAGWLDLGEIHKKYTDPKMPATTLTGANVISSITLENGHVTGVTTRAMTAAEIGGATAVHNHAFGEITSLPTKTILANSRGVTGNAEALTVSQFLALIAITYGSANDLAVGTSTANSTWTAKNLNDWVTTRLVGYLKVVNLELGTRNITTVPITNSAGDGVTLLGATPTLAGVMTGADKEKLDSIETGALNNPHPQLNPGGHPFATKKTFGVEVLSQLVVNEFGHTVAVQSRELTTADIAGIMIDLTNDVTNESKTWSAKVINDKLQAAINQAQTGALTYKGEYNPVTNVPDIKVITPPGTIKAGYTYVVSVSGTFLGETVEAGDMIIAKEDNPGASIAKWQLVNKNIPAIIQASLTAEGIIQLATSAEAIAGVNALKAITPFTLKAVLDAKMGVHYATFGNGTGTSYPIPHLLNNTNVDVIVRRVSDRREVIVDWAVTSASTVTVNVNEPVANNALEILITEVNRLNV